MARPKGTTGTQRITKKLTESICKMLEIAVPQKYAAEANGIHEKTFEYWMRKGEEGDPSYVNFFRAATRAKAKAVPNMHVRALSGGKGSNAAMWLLERRHHEEYGLRQRVDYSNMDPIKSMSAEERDREIVEQEKLIVEFERLKRVEDITEGS